MSKSNSPISTWEDMCKDIYKTIVYKSKIKKWKLCKPHLTLKDIYKCG